MIRFLPRLICAVLLVSAVSASCADRVEGPVRDGAARTLHSFRQIDDYPLYIMRQYGDYGFDDYLDGNLSSVVPPSGARPLNWGCTTFAAFGEDADSATEPLLGRNFDWENHMALLLYAEAPDGFASVSVVDLSYLGFVPGDSSTANMNRLLPAALWPFDGMNEKGVAVGLMAVPSGDGGNDPAKKTIGTLAVVRLVLDYAANVNEAIELISRYNVSFTGGPPVHYLISDPAGSVVIEFVDGQMRAIPCDRSWQVATNFTLSSYSWDGHPSECWRYNKVYNTLASANGAIDRREAMALLRDVSQPNTMWSVVYGASTATVSIAPGGDYRELYEYTLDDLEDLR